MFSYLAAFFFFILQGTQAPENSVNSIALHTQKWPIKRCLLGGNLPIRFLNKEKKIGRGGVVAVGLGRPLLHLEPQPLKASGADCLVPCLLAHSGLCMF